MRMRCCEHGEISGLWIHRFVRSRFMTLNVIMNQAQWAPTHAWPACALHAQMCVAQPTHVPAAWRSISLKELCCLV